MTKRSAGEWDGGHARQLVRYDVPAQVQAPVQAPILGTVPPINDVPRDIIERILAILCASHPGGGAAFTLVNRHVHEESQRYLGAFGDIRLGDRLQRIADSLAATSATQRSWLAKSPKVARNPWLWLIWRERFTHKLESLEATFPAVDGWRLCKLVASLRFARLDPLFWQESFDTLLAHVRGLRLPAADLGALLDAMGEQLRFIDEPKQWAVSSRRLRDAGRAGWPPAGTREDVLRIDARVRAEIGHGHVKENGASAGDWLLNRLELCDRTEDAQEVKLFVQWSRLFATPQARFGAMARIAHRAGRLDNDAVLDTVTEEWDSALMPTHRIAGSTPLKDVIWQLENTAHLMAEQESTVLFERACIEIQRANCRLRVELLGACGTAMDLAGQVPAQWRTHYFTAASCLMNSSSAPQGSFDEVARAVHHIPAEQREEMALKILKRLAGQPTLSGVERMRAAADLCKSVPKLETAAQRDALAMLLAQWIPLIPLRADLAWELHDVFASQMPHVSPDAREGWIQRFLIGSDPGTAKGAASPLGLEIAVAPYLGWLRPGERGRWFEKYLFGVLGVADDATVVLDAVFGARWLSLVQHALGALRELPRNAHDAWVVAKIHRVLQPMLDIYVVEGMEAPPADEVPAVPLGKRIQLYNFALVLIDLAHCLHLLPAQEQWVRCANLFDAARAFPRTLRNPGEAINALANLAHGACSMSRSADRGKAAEIVVELMAFGEDAVAFTGQQSLDALSALMSTLAPEELARLVPKLLELEAIIQLRTQANPES